MPDAFRFGTKPGSLLNTFFELDEGEDETNDLQTMCNRYHGRIPWTMIPIGCSSGDSRYREEEPMTSDPNHRGQIEAWLHRPLTDEELRPVSSLDMLRDDQVSIVASIQPRNLIAPLLFLRAVVPTARRQDIIDHIDSIEDVYIMRFPPPELPDQRIFEHYAGRPLEPAERFRAGTVYKMKSAQVELAKTLALKDLTVAFLYLSRVAPDETIEQRHYVAKHLAGLV